MFNKLLLFRPFYHNVWEPLSLLYIAGYVRRFFPNLQISVMDASFDGIDRIMDEASKSDIIGISSTTPQLKEALNWAKFFKNDNADVKTVLGGFGPSFQSEKCLQKYVDHVVIGEGEEALKRIISGQEKQRLVSVEPIENLDKLPFPARDLIDLERYISIAEREEGRRVTSVVTERGCLFRCTFCNEGYGRAWNKAILTGKEDMPVVRTSSNEVRLRNPKNIVNEMEQVKKEYDIEFFKTSDAETNPTKEHFISLCRTICERKLNVDWGCSMRADLVDEEICYWAAKARCTEFWIGVESGNEEILKHYNKGITLDKIRYAFATSQKFSIFRRAHIILGAPMESYKTIQDTEKLIDEINPDQLGFTILVPYPGTMYYSDKTWGNIDWSTIDNYCNTYWFTQFLTNKELRGEQARLMERYHDRLAPIVTKKKNLGVIK